MNDGAAADLEAKRKGSAAAKFAAAAYAHQSRGQRAAALAAADKALANSEEGRIKFLAARIFVEAGEFARAEALAATLSNNLRPEMQAYGKIVAANIAGKKKDGVGAVKLLTEANGLLDTWIGHFDLGRAYLDMSAFPQADAEFDRCIKRRGEALSLLVDEEPTYRYFPPVYYYQGLVREGLKNAASADSFRQYLAIRGNSTEDPLLPDIRRRVGQ